MQALTFFILFQLIVLCPQFAAYATDERSGVESKWITQRKADLYANLLADPKCRITTAHSLAWTPGEPENIRRAN